MFNALAILPRVAQGAGGRSGSLLSVMTVTTGSSPVVNDAGTPLMPGRAVVLAEIGVQTDPIELSTASTATTATTTTTSSATEATKPAITATGSSNSLVPSTPTTPKPLDVAALPKRIRDALEGPMMALSSAASLAAGADADAEIEFAGCLEAVVRAVVASQGDLDETATRIVDMHEAAKEGKRTAAVQARELESLRSQVRKLQEAAERFAAERTAAAAAAAASSAAAAAAAPSPVVAVKAEESPAKITRGASSGSIGEEDGDMYAYDNMPSFPFCFRLCSSSSFFAHRTPLDPKAAKKELSSMKKKVKKYKAEVKKLQEAADAQTLAYNELERRLQTKIEKDAAAAAAAAAAQEAQSLASAASASSASSSSVDKAAAASSSSSEKASSMLSAKESVEDLASSPLPSASHMLSSAAAIKRLPSITNAKTIDFMRVYRSNDSYKTIAYSTTTTVDDLLKAVCEKCDLTPPDKYAIYESVQPPGAHAGAGFERLVDPVELVVNLRGVWRQATGQASAVQLERRVSVRLKRSPHNNTLLESEASHVPHKLRTLRQSFILQNAQQYGGLAAAVEGASGGPGGNIGSPPPRSSKKEGLLMLFSGKM